MLKLSCSYDYVRFGENMNWMVYKLLHFVSFFNSMCNTIVGAGAAWRYGSGSGSGSDQKMRLRNTAFFQLTIEKFILQFCGCLYFNKHNT
jgi:hypothetical protein